MRENAARFRRADALHRFWVVAPRAVATVPPAQAGAAQPAHTISDLGCAEPVVYPLSKINPVDGLTLTAKSPLRSESEFSFIHHFLQRKLD